VNSSIATTLRRSLRIADMTHLGVSDWIEITQDDVRAFGVLTRSSERIHDDPEWAGANTPFGGTIAHGFQLLSLLTAFLADVRPWRSQDAKAGQGARISVNYGFDKVRFIAPVRVGARVRGRFDLLETQAIADGRVRTKMMCLIEIEGEDKPAVTAEWLGMMIEAPS
jgi:acyl dehydratase